MRIKPKYFVFLCSVSLLLLLSALMLKAQPLPPRPIEVIVSPTQYLSFGAFYHGSTGGSVSISPEGFRSSSGDVVLLNMGVSFSSGLYEIVANPGTLISILNGPNVTLNGSSGGSLILEIGDSYPYNPFIISTTPPNGTQLFIGGTIYIGNQFANPPGNYSGTFDIIFVQE